MATFRSGLLLLRQTRLQTENPGRGRPDLNNYQLENGHAVRDRLTVKLRSSQLLLMQLRGAVNFKPRTH